MSGRGSPESSFDVYIYQIPGPGSAAPRRPTRPDGRREHASHRRTLKQRDRTAMRLKRKAAEFLAQAGELRKLVAHLSTPENLVSGTVFACFESLIPRLNSIFQIAAVFRDGFRKNRFPSGLGGLEFVLRVVKNLVRQIEAALALAELESGRCRRRPATFDLRRLLEEASRRGQNHYLAGEVGLNVNRTGRAMRIRGKRPLWFRVVVDLICRAEELSPRKGIAARLRRVDGDTVTLTLVPRGALITAEEAQLREQRRKLLGRTGPGGDSAFLVTQALVNRLGGRLTVGKRYRSYIMPLFTLEIPAAPPGEHEPR